MLTRLSEQTSRLVRDEVRLAQAELTAKARQGGIGAGFLSVGGLLAWFGVGVLITTPALGLERTITNVKQDVAEVKEHTRHDTR
ncbi:phage holin family protein [Nesterenkonia sp. YGD6]|uniref:phage holin family protein n=1 Tax=Nesterenkonia sp. YGD6 TaxID=2901231 RepID=UPI001F4D2BC7|nr:phage holin family protein [Nesterenkonia sp. YGD6]MCH8562747.1 phage holin family protein [Nesterenkonia sp. YGD6]